MSCPPQLWDGVLRRLEAYVPEFTLDAWVRPLVAKPNGEGLRLLCPSPFHRERIRDRFLPGIARCAEEEAGRSILIELGVARRRPAPPPERTRQAQASEGGPLLGKAPKAPRSEAQPSEGRPLLGKAPKAPRSEAQPSEGRPLLGKAPEAPRSEAEPSEGGSLLGKAPEAPRSEAEPSEGGSLQGKAPEAPRSEAEPSGGGPRQGKAPEAPRSEAEPSEGGPLQGKAPRPESARPRPSQPLLSRTFDSFVVGPCNALAREACFALVHGQQRSLNPLYLSSEPGLGKTHLARAVVHEARRCGSQRTIYDSAESFTNCFTNALRSKSMDRFKRRYREQCDLLVVEDLQFLSSKTSTQLEFFHTLMHLVDAGLRVALTGDRLPRNIEGLDPRLRSQITAGLVAEIEPPDATVRRNILRSKAAAGGVRVPDDCLDLLVEAVRGSVRDLEGALIQLVTTAALLKRSIDLELTHMALRKLTPVPPRKPHLEPETVIDVVASFFGTTRAALASRSRRRDVLVPRQLAMYLCRRYTDHPLSRIARAFDRDHPAVSNAVKVVERKILERAPLRYQVEELSARLDRL